jgi:hypothetical protein
MARHINKKYEMRDTDTEKDTALLEEKEGKVMICGHRMTSHDRMGLAQLSV